MAQTPPQQYCLRWNNYQNNLTNVFDQLLQSEAFVDVTLACDGHSLKAHKMVLSACSPFFQTLFFDNPCTHPIVILKDISWDELKSVVEFMYRGEINVSQEQLAPLLKVAEMLKIRGLADVSRGSGGGRDGVGSNGNEPSGSYGGSTGSSVHRSGPNPADFMSTSNHDSEPDSPVHSNGHLLNHPLLQGHHLNPLTSLLNPSGSTSSPVASAASTLHRRKRRKMSTPERTPSPPEDDLDDHSSNQLEVDSQNGDWNNDHSPRSVTADQASTSGEPLSSLAGSNLPSGIGLSMSLTRTPTPANTPSLSAAATVGMSLAGNSSLGSTTASSLVGPLGPAFLNLHAAAAAAVASANSNAGGSGGGGGVNNPPSTSSSLASDLDLKPGIVEMIREEERAKMLESSHGWLGPSAASTLTDTYQYQIQNLWQKCWNQNQGGIVHALRFRERGPLKSWRPETMAEAIFAVLRDGLSLSQAARKYDIPYPTFVLYANRVHNMLGPSTDGCSGSDLMSDMRPKGRGRPQRILLGTWPEEHIRGVIRAVVFRDTPGGKDDFPFIFNRETGLCLPQTSTSSHNGSVDISLSQQFGSPFLNPGSSGGSSLLHHHQQSQSTTSIGSSSSGGNSSAAGAQQNAANLSNSAGHSSSNPIHGVNLININEHGAAAAAATVAALQHLQQLEQQGTLSASTTSGLPPPGSPSSSSNSPLQQVLNSAAAGLLSVQAQRELLALQQRHQLQQQQRRASITGSRDPRDDASPLGLLMKKSLSSLSGTGTSKDDPSLSSVGLISDSEILQIKAELPSSLGSDGGAGNDEVEENDNEDLEGNNLASNRHKRDEQDDGNDHAEVILLNEGDDEGEHFDTAFKHSVNNPGQSSSSSSAKGSSGCGSGCGTGQNQVASTEMMETHHQKDEQQTDFVKILNRNSTSPEVISRNNDASFAGNSPKSLRSSGITSSGNDFTGNTSCSNNNNGPKGSTSNNSSNNHNNNAGNSNRNGGSSRGIENNNPLAAVAESMARQDGQGTISSSTSSATTFSTNPPLAEATSKRASLRGTSGSGGEGASSCGTTSATPSGTSGIPTRSSSSRGGEREVNTPSPLNFHQNPGSTS